MADFTLSAKITGDASSFDKAIKGAESSLSNLGKLSSDLGNKLTKYITKPALAAGTALAGITLVKGWNRLTALDEARAKLKAIGNTAEDVEQIMNDALASVKGTAFGMDEAATTAASAVAAGIEPGKELEKYLTAVADAAAVAGTDMESMGAIFNKVATQGKANNEVLQQLAEKGIPIYQYLAEETGKTAEEIFEMASNGEIDLATFQRAVETHISGAAVAMGDATLTGAIDNLMASISRIGANFLGSADDASTFGGQVREIIIDLRKNVLEPLEAKAADLGKVFGKFFADTVDRVKSLITSFQEMNEATDGALGKFTAFGSAALVALGPVLKIVGGIVTSMESGLLSTLGKLVPGFSKLLGPISAVATAIALMWKNSEIFRDGVLSVIAAVMPIIENLFSAIMSMIDALSPAISQIATIVGNVVGAIMQILSPLISFIGNTVASLIEEISGALGHVADIFNKVFGGIIDFITGVFTGNWKKAWKGISSIFSGIWDGLVAIVKTPINGIIGLINGVIGGINSISVKIPDWVPGLGGKKLGFNIGKIPYLAQGTDNFQGGFAVINERGGELVSLPDGTQVIPHDISVQYAREAARANSVNSIDLTGILEGVIINVYSQTNVDGTPLMQKSADYTIKKIANQQRGNMRMRGQLV
jgi:tape measure domain-containing protein